MITIEITASNEPLAIGIYEYQFDTIFIGRSKKADLIFDDSDLPLKFLTLRFVGEHFVIQNEPMTPFYFVNKKKMSGSRKLNIGDKIQFGTHVISILNFKKNASESGNEELSEFYEKINKQAPELKFLLSYLEEEIIYFESTEKK
jgi:pSer/pThr/pTyr-binding forkhead associated (FHA) protein